MRIPEFATRFATRTSARCARDICKIDGERQSLRRQLWQERERNSLLRIQDEWRRTATRRRNSPPSPLVFAVSRAGNKCMLRANLAECDARNSGIRSNCYARYYSRWRSGARRRHRRQGISIRAFVF